MSITSRKYIIFIKLKDRNFKRVKIFFNNYQPSLRLKNWPAMASRILAPVYVYMGSRVACDSSRRSKADAPCAFSVDF
jgi:hypothetical protein